MSGWLAWLKSRFRGQDGDVLHRLQVLRFRKLLENARGVVTLIDDGQEKLQGEYILDRHYVISLVEQVLQRLGRMVFDGCLLVPEGGAELYRQLDEQRRYARAHVIDAPDREGQGDEQEPEYRLLARALAWMTGEGLEDDRSVMALFRQVFDHVVTGLVVPTLDDGPVLRVSASPVDNRMLVTELQPALRDDHPSALSIQDLRCRPLGLVVVGKGLDGEARPPATPAGQRWQVALGPETLSMVLVDPPGHTLRLEATLTGNPSTDYIFLLSTADVELEQLLADRFAIERTRSACLAWTYGSPEDEMEQDLLNIGASLLGGAWRPSREAAGS